MRIDLDIIQNWIPTGSHVLDLGCGDGTLLKALQQNRSVSGYGLDIDPRNIVQCIQKGVNVVQKDLDQGLAEFADQSFDCVVMTQALQTVRFPHLLLFEMLRIGREVIVTFPNFGNWRSRLYLATQGKMPVTRKLPKEWYETDNIHFCTIKDFEILCRESDICIHEQAVVNNDLYANLLTRLLPNLLGEGALYRLSRPVTPIT